MVQKRKPILLALCAGMLVGAYNALRLFTVGRHALRGGDIEGGVLCDVGGVVQCLLLVAMLILCLVHMRLPAQEKPGPDVASGEA